MIKFLEKLILGFRSTSEYKEIEDVDASNPMLKVIHESEEVVNLEHYRQQPRLISQNISLYDLTSFMNYIEKFKPDNDSKGKHGKTVIFVKLTENGVSVSSVIDYHSAYNSASHCNHNISLSCNTDESFDKWSKYDNQWMSQNKMINLLKMFNGSFKGDSFTEVLQAIQEIGSKTDLTQTQKENQSGSTKVVFFDMIKEFKFYFKPYFSMPFLYWYDADLYVQLDDNNRIELKYSIRNKYKIHEQVAKDLRKEFNQIEDVSVF